MGRVVALQGFTGGWSTDTASPPGWFHAKCRGFGRQQKSVHRPVVTVCRSYQVGADTEGLPEGIFSFQATAEARSKDAEIARNNMGCGLLVYGRLKPLE